MEIGQPELTGLLERCAEAHHQAYIASGGVDPEWPAWYGAWLQTHLGDRLGGEMLSRSELAYRLIRAERATPAGEPWPAAYAVDLLSG